MGRVVAISSGHMEDLTSIHAYIVNMSDKKNVLFIPTASENSESYMRSIKEVFEKLNCQVKNLCLPEDAKEVDSLLDWAGIIYVGGGDTQYMMEIWKQFELDKKLVETYKKDRAILCGISAGAMCWFHCGHSSSDDFDGGYGWVKGLNLYPYILCPHYEERTNSFDSMILEKDMPGLALETNTAFVENNGEIKFISTDVNKCVFILDKNRKEIQETWKL